MDAEDEEFMRIELEQQRIKETQAALRKELELANKAFDVAHDNFIRNAVLEEVAQEFDKMRFGNTSASFAAYVRGMKK
jgi:hypothetical protein